MKYICISLLCAIVITVMLRDLRGEESVAKLNEGLFLGKPVVVDNITAWPVFSTRPQEDADEYVTLAQAQEKGLARVRETGSANPDVTVNQQAASNLQRRQVEEGGGAHVNELIIENRGDKAILVLAGTLVKGGKQDRQIAEDFIILPGKSVPVGAFCVEHGRWTANREEKDTGGLFQAQKCLAVKEVRASGQYNKDQGEVWKNVALSNAKAQKEPGTGTLLASVEETDKEALSRRERIRKALAERFNAPDSASVGMAYAVDGKIKEIRTFSHTKIFALYRETLVNTVAMEGDLAQRVALADKRNVYDKPADVQRAVDLIKEAEKATEQITDTKADNRNGYKKSQTVNNGNLYMNDVKNQPKTSSPVSQSWQAND